MNWSYAVLSYNHIEHTKNCVRSILAIAPKSRIYLIHNGTERKQRLGLEAEFPTNTRFQHIVLESNKGYSGGLNSGLSEIFKYEEFVFVLTNDTELTEIPLSPIVPSVVIPLLLNKRTKKVDSFGGYFVPGRGHLYHNKNLDSEFVDSSHQRTYIPGSAFLIDRTSFQATQGFWTDLGTYWEDVEWSQRLKHAGFPLTRNSGFKLYHKIGKTCHKDKFYTTYLYQRNRLVVSWLYTSSFNQSTQRLQLIAHSIFQFGKWIVRSMIRPSGSSLRLYIRALRHAIKMIKENATRPQQMS